MLKEDKQLIIGKIIRKARISKKQTQQEVAKAIGISRNYLSDVENGRYMPSVETLFALVAYLKIDLNSVPVKWRIYKNFKKINAKCSG